MKHINLSEWAITHREMVLFLMLAIICLGIFSYSQLGRSEDPAFNVPIMTSVVIWPGAAAEEIQDQVLHRIESKLRELGGFEYVRSFSRQGYGVVSLRMKGRMEDQELQNAWYQARKKITDIRHQFPSGVLGPYYNDEFNDVYMSLYALRGEGVTPAELQEYAEKIKGTLQGISTLSKVDILGKQSEKIFVEVSTRRLAESGIYPQLLINTLARQNMLNPSGSVETEFDRVFARVDGALHNVEDVKSVSIEVDGQLVRLSDIATVYSGYEDPPGYAIRHNGHPVLGIGLTMVRDANILNVGSEIEKRVNAIKADLPIGISLESYADQAKVVEESIWEFEKSFIEALGIVLVVSFLSLGLRAGSVVAVSVPLVLCIVLTVMYVAGWNLDRISLGSLIIALGLLVDDAIIAVEMMVVKMEQGWDRMAAATYAYQSTAFPMLAGTMVTAAGFMPVGFADSIAGAYAGGIFWVVGVALIASWVVAVVFTPYIGVNILPAVMLQGQNHTDPYDGVVYYYLRRLVKWCVQFRWKVLLATAGLLFTAVAGMTIVQQQFFPTASRLELLVELRMKEGASFKATLAQVRDFETILTEDAGIDFFTAYIGAGSPRFYLSMEPELPSPGFAQFVIMTDSIESREEVRKRLLELFAKDEKFPEVRGRVSRLEFGPPVGFPVQFRIIGPDLNTVRAIAHRVRDVVQESPLVRDTQLNWDEQVRSLRVKVDHEKVRLLGLSSDDITATLHTVLTGVSATKIRRENELIDVIVRGDTNERNRFDHIEDINLFSRTGAVVPLSEVAIVESVFEDPVLWRWNRNMSITVRSDLEDGIQGPYATEEIWPSLYSVLEDLPAGYRIEKGGAIEESLKANQALLAIFPVMFLVMLFFLMMQLQSFSRVFMVFMTAPLGIIGVVPALLIFNAPFGFVALLGVIALGGMIMRNSVILVDQIEHDISAGSEPWQAIVDATVRRSRPVLLTAAAAILAMIPLSYSMFWGPMAISIMGGLIVGTALIIGFVPALYAAWFKVRVL